MTLIICLGLYVVPLFMETLFNRFQHSICSLSPRAIEQSSKVQEKAGSRGMRLKCRVYVGPDLGSVFSGYLEV